MKKRAEIRIQVIIQQNPGLIQVSNVLVSVILRGMPRDLTGTAGEIFFFILFAISTDFCIRSAFTAADLGFLFNVKCFFGTG